jgi:hypothetical protein
MLLFRYFASHTLETLRESELKVSKASDFNDPFEFMFDLKGEMTPTLARKMMRNSKRQKDLLNELKRQEPRLSTREAKARLKSRRKVMINRLVSQFDSTRPEWLEKRLQNIDAHLRLVCFSAQHDDPLNEILMWSHYADSHRGVRIGFEFPEANYPFAIVPVNYEKKRVELDFPRIGQPESSIALVTAIQKSIRTKSSAWKYENEYRLLIEPRLCRADRGFAQMEFLPFNRAWVRRVDFGLKCPIPYSKSILEVVRQKYVKVDCFIAKYHDSDYALKYEPVTSER